MYTQGPWPSSAVPFPSMLAKVVGVGTTYEQPPGEVGEPCLAGPAVMQGYLDQPAESAAALRVHSDGRSCPREVESRQNLPLTLVGKVDFRRIEAREQARRAAARAAG